jgi:autotransporter translocation and assembly factor TamB
MRYLRRILKIIGLSLSGILFLLLILVILLQAGTLNSFIASTASSRLSKSIEGEIQVKQLQGNIFSRFSLENVKVIHEDTTILNLRSLQIDYTFSALLRKQIKSDFIRLKELEVYVSQNVDSTWNFQDVFPSQKNIPKEDTTQKQFDWVIDVKEIEVDKLKASVNPLNKEQVPSDLKFSLLTDLEMKAGNIQAQMKNLSLVTSSPDLEIKKLTGIFAKQKNRLTWNDFNLEFKRSRIQGKGSVNLDSLVASHVDLQVSPLDISEFKPWMPDIELRGTPNINLKITSKETKTDISLFLEEGVQRIRLNGWYSQAGEKPEYNLALKVDSLDGEYWTGNPEMKSLLNGRFNVQGEGIDFKQNSLSAKGRFGDFRYGDYKLDDLILNINKDQTNIMGDIETDAWFGRVRSIFNVKEIFSRIQYDVEAYLNNIDLSKLSTDSKLKSNLNITLKAIGNGKEPKSMETNAILKIDESSFLGHPVQSMDAEIDYSRQNYDIKGLKLESNIASFNLKGKGHLERNNHFDFYLEARDIRPLMKAFNQSGINLEGIVNGTLRGPVDSIDLNLEYDLTNLEYDSIYADFLTGEASALYGDSLVNANTEFEAGSVSKDSLQINRVQVNAGYQPNQIDSRINVNVHDSLSLFVDNRLTNMSQDPMIYLRKLSVEAWDDNWMGGSDSTTILMDQDSIRINHFNLSAGRQEMSIHGKYAFRDEEDLEIKLDNIDLSVIPKLTAIRSDIQGSLNLSILLKDSARNPSLNGLLYVDKPRIDSISFRSFRSNFHYSNDSINFYSNLDTEKGKLFTANAQLPFHISLVDSFSLPDRNTPITAEASIYELDLNMINPFILNQDIYLEGKLSANVKIDSTISTPNYRGDISMHSGRFTFQEQGMDYKDIMMNSEFSSQRFHLKELKMNSGDGYLRADGSIDLELLEPEKTSNIRFNLKGKQFQAIKSHRMNVTVEPDIRLNGTLENPVIKGNMKIVRSLINSDAMLAKFSVKSDNPNPPLLVQAMKDTAAVSQVKKDTVEQDDQIIQELNFYRNLRGRFDIIIPGNTWVRGQDMNFEVQGDLQAVKEGELIDLFGTLNINRGYIQYFGKKFEFDQGSMTFTGGKEIDPLLDFVIAYNFRDVNRELRTISIHITGRSRQPELAFNLDGKKIQEKEALSYIIFGKSTGQLTESEQVSVEKSAADLAASLAMGQVANLVKGALQSTLALDVFEIAGGETWKSGRVEIGKYITDDLYLGYQQTFAFDKKEKTIDPEKVTLEYQIMRSLFFQATNQGSNSGFDLIFKKTWK